MKVLIGGLVLLAASSTSVMARYTDNCEFLYWSMNKEKPEITLEQYMNAQCPSGAQASGLIGKAERYKLASLKREQEIKDKMEERIAAAKGERAGKIVRRFEASDFSSIPQNPLGLAVAAKVTIIRYNKRDKTYETSSDHLCRQLGYQKALTESYSPEISDDNIRQRDLMPDRMIEFRQARGFRSASVENHNLLDRNKGYGIVFQMFESVTCEKTRLANEPVEEFEIDINAIRRALEEEVRAPKLDVEVEQILSLGRTMPERVEREVGENKEEEVDEEEYTPTTWEEDDNPYVYKSRSK